MAWSIPWKFRRQNWGNDMILAFFYIACVIEVFPLCESSGVFESSSSQGSLSSHDSAGWQGFLRLYVRLCLIILSNLWEYHSFSFSMLLLLVIVALAFIQKEQRLKQPWRSFLGLSHFLSHLFVMVQCVVLIELALEYSKFTNKQIQKFPDLIKNLGTFF